MAKQSTQTRDLRHRILTCMTKLSDRDTHSQAVSELESIIPTLTPDTFSLFINSLSSTSTADRSFVRSSSLKLLASLSSFHGPSLSSHNLNKLISAVIRRLRDPDSAVRTICASTSAAIAASNSAAFSAVFRPLADSLATEQEASAQSAAAMCVAAVIDGANERDENQIVRFLPKWMKLLKCDGFKAKSAMVAVVKSVVRVCEIGNRNLLRDLVILLMEFLKSEDWASRKAASEALKEIAVVERDSLSVLKAGCLKTFESRKFDKVKAVREAMIEMLEAWKEIPDVFDDGSPPPQSQASSKENASDGHYPARSKISSAINSNTPQIRRKHVPLRRSSPSDSALKTTAGTRGGPDFLRKKSSMPGFRKPDSRKPSGRNVNAADLQGSSVTPVYDDNPAGDDEGFLRKGEVRSLKPGTKRGLFNRNIGSPVVPYPEEHSGATVAPADICMHHKDCEGLSQIRKQLGQIENQQSSLMDLLQKFIGSSQDGMRTLETRVQGLELALDDISYDLAVSTARMSAAEPPRTSCCLLPGSDFLCSKFWRRPEGRTSNSRFSFSGRTPSVSAMRNLAVKSPAGGTLKLEDRRFHVQGAGGVIVNPLAGIHADSRGISEASSSRMLRTVHNVS